MAGLGFKRVMKEGLTEHESFTGDDYDRNYVGTWQAFLFWESFLLSIGVTEIPVAFSSFGMQ